MQNLNWQKYIAIVLSQRGCNVSLCHEMHDETDRFSVHCKQIELLLMTIDHSRSFAIEQVIVMFFLVGFLFRVFMFCCSVCIFLHLSTSLRLMFMKRTMSVLSNESDHTPLCVHLQ